MKIKNNIFAVIFIGLSIIVGLNLEYFINKTSEIIYEVSGQKARDLEREQELEQKKYEQEYERRMEEYAIETERHKPIFARLKNELDDEMKKYISLDEIQNLFDIKVVSEENLNFCLYENGDDISIHNKSNEPIEFINVRFMIYNEKTGLEYFNKTTKISFEYFLEPGEIKNIWCKKWRNGNLAIDKNDYKALKNKFPIFKYEIIGTDKHIDNQATVYDSDIFDKCEKLDRIVRFHSFEENKELFQIEEKYQKFCDKFD